MANLRRQPDMDIKDEREELARLYEDAPVPILVVDAERHVVRLNRAAAELAAVWRDAPTDIPVGLALHCIHAPDVPQGCGFGPDCPRCSLRQLIDTTLRTGTAVAAKPLSLTTAVNGQHVEIDLCVSTSRFRSAGQTRVMVALIDDTQPGRARRELAAAKRESDGLIAATRALQLRPAFEDAVPAILRECQDLVGASSSWFTVTTGTAAPLWMALRTSTPDAHERAARVALGPLIERSHVGRQAILDDTPTVVERPDLAPAALPKNVLLAPVSLTGHTTGCLILGDKPDGFDPRDLITTQAFAELVAVAHRHAMTQREVLASQEQFRALFDLSPLATAYLDLDQSIIAVNLEFTRQYSTAGRAPSLIGRPLEACVVEAQQPLLARLFDDMHNKRGACGPIVLDLLREDGSIYPAEVRGSAVHNSAGAQLGWFIVAADISALRRIEQNLVTSDRLASLGKLVDGVAHEVNSSLTYMIFNLKSLAKDLPNFVVGAQRILRSLPAKFGTEELAAQLAANGDALDSELFEDAIDRVRESLAGAEKISEVVAALRTFSDDDEEPPGPVSIEEQITRAIRMTYNLTKYRARVCTSLAPGGLVHGSEGRLSQLFVNLLLNAAQAIEPGEVQANEVVVRSQVDEHWVTVEIYDSGAGISPGDLERVCEPFFKGPCAGNGVGLGLTVSRSIAHDLGGDIEIESQPGDGTRVTVRLPRCHSAAEDQDDQEA